MQSMTTNYSDGCFGTLFWSLNPMIKGNALPEQIVNPHLGVLERLFWLGLSAVLKFKS
jgi:hypothetical protein